MNYEVPGWLPAPNVSVDIDVVGQQARREVANHGRSLPRLGPDAVSSLIAAYTAGSTVKALAAEYSINVSTVHSHLKRNDVPLRPFRKLTGDQLSSAVALYQGGSSIFAISKALVVSWNTVETALVEAGLVHNDGAEKPLYVPCGK